MGVFPVTLLLVWCDRVVDECLDAAIGEVLLQTVAFVAEDGEEVVYVVLGGYMVR